MTWVRLDEAFPRHPKIAAAGPLGLALQVAALCYCNEYLTDGFVPAAVAKTLLDFDGIGLTVFEGEHFGAGMDASAELVIHDVLVAGLWKTVKGGYRIHDYHDYQPSKAQILELRKLRAEAGKRGGQASSKQTTKQNASKRQANHQANTQAKSKPVKDLKDLTKAVNQPVDPNGPGFEIPTDTLREMP